MKTTTKIAGTTESIDAHGVTWIWAGHSRTNPEPGDGTAECERLVAEGVLDEAVMDDCDCGCDAGRCLVYRVRAA